MNGSENWKMSWTITDVFTMLAVKYDKKVIENYVELSSYST